MHCHILPGLDDGPGSMEESMQMLSIAEAEGITHIVATPHYRPGRPHAGPQAIRSCLAQVKETASERGIGTALYAGNEVLFHSGMEEALDGGRILTMNGSPFVLVEFLPGDRFLYIRNALDGIMAMGYRPVLAHAERYGCMLADRKNAAELKSMGVRIQVNAGSVTGESGRKAGLFTARILKEGLADYIATDAHKSSGRTPAIRRCRELLHKKHGGDYAAALLYGNAGRDFGIG
jgi:protein-tyrosine phosphatase